MYREQTCAREDQQVVHTAPDQIFAFKQSRNTLAGTVTIEKYVYDVGYCELCECGCGGFVHSDPFIPAY
jgi:hypothetical protein